MKPSGWRPGPVVVLSLVAIASLAACDTKRNTTGGGGGGAATATGTGTGGGEPATGTFHVGHYASLTGSEATFGQSTDQGIRLAIKERNAAIDAGTVKGRKIKLTTLDDAGKPQDAGNAVTRLITQDKVNALLGEVASGLSMVGGQIAQQYNVPMISPSSTNPQVTQIGDMVFRVCFLDDFQGKVMARFAREELKAEKAAILFDQGQPYSKGLADYAEKSFKEMGGKIVTRQAYGSSDPDVSAQLSSIKQASPDVIFLPGYYTQAANIMRQARKLGITAAFVGGDGWDSDKLEEIGGAAVQGSYYSNHYSPEEETPEVKNFVTKYKQEFGATPDGLAALGYDAANLMFAAVDRAPSLGGKDLAATIATTKDFVGVTGKISIDPNRDASKSAVVVKVENGRRVPVKRYEP
ncbi:MAG: ABC transporter substrate-binding protein [Kofleriaceae bacterium]|nr:MAG: ABC transporter substrate-binding protein [Kofleriaceae bacterium]MBZ0233207.1 ABC transporter substrate-binding protein [Kofleriaceae bacterium]